MEAYHFTEFPYPYVPEDYYERYGSIRVTLPNQLFDPQIGADLYERYLDEYVFADEMGLNLMVNEHHQTATCLDVSLSISAAAIIQRTRKSRSRVLLLGHPLPHRDNPLRVAEETAMLDVMSRGRIECGFVRGVGTEIHPANTIPTYTVEKMREAHDLIHKAWHTGEPFSWEGKFYHYRFVNVWPRPYQQPHPPIWITGGTSLESARWVGRLGHRFAAFLTPYPKTEELFNAYREAYRETFHREADSDRFGYLALCYTAETDEAADREGKELLWYLRTRPADWFRTPPGYSPVAAMVKAAGDPKGSVRAADWDNLKQFGVVIAGSPDTVFEKVKYLHERCGVGHLLMMNQAGFLSHERTLKSIELFAKEVLPRIRELGAPAVAQHPEPVVQG